MTGHPDQHLAIRRHPIHCIGRRDLRFHRRVAHNGEGVRSDFSLVLCRLRNCIAAHRVACTQHVMRNDP